jgi:hypothetical protein
MEVTEDDLEVQMSDKKKLEEIDAMNCIEFVDSDVVVQTRLQSTRYIAYVGSQRCLEWKVHSPVPANRVKMHSKNFLRISSLMSPYGIAVVSLSSWALYLTTTDCI